MENKINQTFKNLLKTNGQKLTAIIGGILILAIIVGIIVIAAVNPAPKVTEETLFPTLKLVGELTTAELNYSGYKEYKDSGLPFLNRSNFLMTYQASLRAGIDIEKIEIDVNNKTKTVTLPAAEIQEVKVEPGTIKYYDEEFALFNFNSKEDSDKAQAQAEEEAKVQAHEMGILEHADKHAKTLIENSLQTAVPEDYTIVVK